MAPTMGPISSSSLFLITLTSQLPPTPMRLNLPIPNPHYSLTSTHCFNYPLFIQDKTPKKKHPQHKNYKNEAFFHFKKRKTHHHNNSPDNPIKPSSNLAC